MGSKRCEIGFVGDHWPFGAAAGGQLKHPTGAQIAVTIPWPAEDLLHASIFLHFRIYHGNFLLSAASASLCSSMSPCCHHSIIT